MCVGPRGKWGCEITCPPPPPAVPLGVFQILKDVRGVPVGKERNTPILQDNLVWLGDWSSLALGFGSGKAAGLLLKSCPLAECGIERL